MHSPCWRWKANVAYCNPPPIYRGPTSHLRRRFVGSQNKRREWAQASRGHVHERLPVPLRIDRKYGIVGQVGGTWLLISDPSCSGHWQMPENTECSCRTKFSVGSGSMQNLKPYPTLYKSNLSSEWILRRSAGPNLPTEKSMSIRPIWDIKEFVSYKRVSLSFVALV